MGFGQTARKDDARAVHACADCAPSAILLTVHNARKQWTRANLQLSKRFCRFCRCRVYNFCRDLGGTIRLCGIERATALLNGTVVHVKRLDGAITIGV